MSQPDLFVVCRNCGSEVSPYVTECPYCGQRVRKRAPKLDRSGGEPQPKRRRRRRHAAAAAGRGDRRASRPTRALRDLRADPDLPAVDCCCLPGRRATPRPRLPPRAGRRGGVALLRRAVPVRRPDRLRVRDAGGGGHLRHAARAPLRPAAGGRRVRAVGRGRHGARGAASRRRRCSPTTRSSSSSAPTAPRSACSAPGSSTTAWPRAAAKTATTTCSGVYVIAIVLVLLSLAEEAANIGAAVGGGVTGALLGLALPLFTRKSAYWPADVHRRAGGGGRAGAVRPRALRRRRAHAGGARPAAAAGARARARGGRLVRRRPPLPGALGPRRARRGRARGARSRPCSPRRPAWACSSAWRSAGSSPGSSTRQDNPEGD